MTPEEVERIARELLADPVTQEYQIGGMSSGNSVAVHSIEVAYNPGVSDPAEATVMKAVADMGIKNLRAVRTGKKYTIGGELSRGDTLTIAARLLINPIIQHTVTKEVTSFVTIGRAHV